MDYPEDKIVNEHPHYIKHKLNEFDEDNFKKNQMNQKNFS